MSPSLELILDLPAAAGSVPSRIEIGRHQGAVVVTVHGEFDLAAAAQLRPMLADLIDGQGNLSLIVDLHDATVSATDADDMSVFADAARRAHLRGGAMTLIGPPSLLHGALRRRGLGHVVGAALDHGSSGRDPDADAVRGRERCAHPAGGSLPSPSEGSHR